jgi:hypothetical protein
MSIKGCWLPTGLCCQHVARRLPDLVIDLCRCLGLPGTLIAGLEPSGCLPEAFSLVLALREVQFPEVHAVRHVVECIPSGCC